MLAGFMPPLTPSGASALLTPPPWRYAGQLLSFEFGVDGTVAQMLLPEEFGRATGVAVAHFCEWQATTDGSELLDPVYAQYKEFIVLIEAERDGVRVFYCPFIYVDQDIAMLRGLLQGWPKKHGTVWMTRSYGLDHPAAAPVRAGTRFGASLAVKDRRLAEGVATLTGVPAEPLGFMAATTFGIVAMPSILGTPDPGPRRLARPAVEGRVAGPAYAAEGTLAFFPAPRDELVLLAPRSVGRASLATLAITITGAVPA